MRGLKWIAIVAVLQLASGTAQAQTNETFPPHWQHQDIGDVGAAGTAFTYDDGETAYWEIDAAGSDIWGTADSFHYLYQSIQDGEISIGSPRLENTDPHAKLGLMIRWGLEPGAPHVILDLQPDGSVEFMTRETANGETMWVSGLPAGTAPTFLRLVRTNGVITGYACKAQACQTVGSVSRPDGDAFIGLAVTSHEYGVLNHARSFSPVLQTVPAPWQAFDWNLADVGVPGYTFFQRGTFTVKGAGKDIWGTADSYRYVEQSLFGDGTVTAHLLSQDTGGNTFAKAGVIAVSGSKTVILDVRPTGDVEFMARPVDGAAMQFIAGGAVTLPAWLKLQRVGDDFTASTSQDGTNWQVVGTTTVVMHDNLDSVIRAGLAVTSHDPTVLHTAMFDHVVVLSGASHDIDIGDSGAIGSVSATDVDFTVRGAGADIWGTQDAFNFFYENMNGDGGLQARILSLDNTDTFAKAGVMVRASTNPSSAHFMLNVRPGGDLELLLRSFDGGTTQFVGTAHVSFPVVLRVWRKDGYISADYSQDGRTVQQLGIWKDFLPADVLIGVAVTSHERGVLASAVVDNIYR